MADYICRNCSRLFSEGEQVRWTEPHGENMAGCPYCKEGFDDITSESLCNGIIALMGDLNRAAPWQVKHYRAHIEELWTWLKEDMEEKMASCQSCGRPLDEADIYNDFCILCCDAETKLEQET